MKRIDERQLAGSRSAPGMKLHVGVFVVVIAALFLWLRADRDEPAARDQPAAQGGSGESAGASAAAPQTVAAEWRWNEFSRAERAAANRAQRGVAPAPFSTAAVHQALRAVELDPYGRVVLDHKALHGLRKSFAPLRGELAPEQIAQLQDIIRKALPAPAGEEVATVVADYHRYHVALARLDHTAPVQASDAANLEALRTRQAQLTALQDEYLGAAAASLFAEERQYQRYMIEAMNVAATPGLSEQDKSTMQAQLREQLPPGVIARDLPSDAVGLQRFRGRFEAYARQREAIERAALPAGEAAQQLEHLLRQHFSEDEFAAVRDFEDRLAAERSGSGGATDSADQDG